MLVYLLGQMDGGEKQRRGFFFCRDSGGFQLDRLRAGRALTRFPVACFPCDDLLLLSPTCQILIHLVSLEYRTGSLRCLIDGVIALSLLMMAFLLLF